MNHCFRFIFSGDDLDLAPGKTIELDKSESYHLASVLRLREEELVEVRSLNQNLSFLCSITSSSPSASIVTIIKGLALPKITNAVHLICAIVKPDTADNIVEKCVEVGVHSISFVETENSKKEFYSSIKSRHDRFIRIRNSAIKQCGSPTLTKLSMAETLSNAFKLLPLQTARKIFCASDYECLIDNNLKPLSIINTLARCSSGSLNIQNGHSTVDTYIVIGPEGGFSQEEITLMINHDFLPVSLGENVLRTDTAAMLACGLLLIN